MEHTGTEYVGTPEVGEYEITVLLFRRVRFWPLDGTTQKEHGPKTGQN